MSLSDNNPKMIRQELCCQSILTYQTVCLDGDGLNGDGLNGDGLDRDGNGLNGGGLDGDGRGRVEWRQVAW